MRGQYGDDMLLGLVGSIPCQHSVCDRAFLLAFSFRHRATRSILTFIPFSSCGACVNVGRSKNNLIRVRDTPLGL